MTDVARGGVEGERRERDRAASRAGRPRRRRRRRRATRPTSAGPARSARRRRTRRARPRPSRPARCRGRRRRWSPRRSSRAPRGSRDSSGRSASSLGERDGAHGRRRRRDGDGRGGHAAQARGTLAASAARRGRDVAHVMPGAAEALRRTADRSGPGRTAPAPARTGLAPAGATGSQGRSAAPSPAYGGCVRSRSRPAPRAPALAPAGATEQPGAQCRLPVASADARVGGSAVVGWCGWWGSVEPGGARQVGGPRVRADDRPDRHGTTSGRAGPVPPGRCRARLPVR